MYAWVQTKSSCSERLSRSSAIAWSSPASACALSQSPSTTRATSSNDEANSIVGSAPCRRAAEAACSATTSPCSKSSWYISATAKFASSRGSPAWAGLARKTAMACSSATAAGCERPSIASATPAIHVAQNSATLPEPWTSWDASAARRCASLHSRR